MSQFDRTVLSAVGVLVVAIVLTIALGDRVGVRVTRVAPLGEAHSTDDILIGFTEAMDRGAVGDRLSIDPPIEGRVSWSGDTLFFRPDEPLVPGVDYTVTLEAGTESIGGRKVLSDYQFSFRVRQPLVAYLAPADRGPQNIWIADPTDPAGAEQITFSPAGVFDFDVSPDGRQIAFAERRTDRPAADIKVLDLDEGMVRAVTNCEDSDCTSPVWRPDGNTIAYTRIDFNSLLPDLGVSPSRVWLANLTTNPPSSQPLFNDSQVLGYGPQWSSNGNRITLFDNSLPGILIYDFAVDDVQVIQSQHGTSGALSPEGGRLVYPELVFDESRARSRLLLADLNTQEITPLTDTSEQADDDTAVWHPDGTQLAVGRRYWDDRYTRGLQIYLMDAETGETEPLLVDERYAHGFFLWDPTGEQLVMQRFPQLTEDGEINTAGRPEVWTYDVERDELVMVAENAFFPRWVP